MLYPDELSILVGNEEACKDAAWKMGISEKDAMELKELLEDYELEDSELEDFGIFVKELGMESWLLVTPMDQQLRCWYLIICR